MRPIITHSSHITHPPTDPHPPSDTPSDKPSPTLSDTPFQHPNRSLKITRLTMRTSQCSSTTPRSSFTNHGALMRYEIAHPLILPLRHSHVSSRTTYFTSTRTPCLTPNHTPYNSLSYTLTNPLTHFISPSSPLGVLPPSTLTDVVKRKKSTMMI